MASVMAASEEELSRCCYIASKKIVPQIRLSVAQVSRNAIGELFRYAGSYQLVNLLEVLYVWDRANHAASHLGTETAGIYALTARLVQAALMIPSALILPNLSGGAMVFASGSLTEMRTLINKSFKVTLALGLLPRWRSLRFLGPRSCSHGLASLLPRWEPPFTGSVRQVCFRPCRCSLWCFIASSGKALLDNVRQALRCNSGFHRNFCPSLRVFMAFWLASLLQNSSE